MGCRGGIGRMGAWPCRSGRASWALLVSERTGQFQELLPIVSWGGCSCSSAMRWCRELGEALRGTWSCGAGTGGLQALLLWGRQADPPPPQRGELPSSERVSLGIPSPPTVAV